MANICDNRIAVTEFDSEDSEKINNCFKNFPKGVGRPRKSPIGSDYGSKSLEIYDVYEDDGFIDVTCGSAWRPPDEWARLLSKKFKCTVRIKYDEEAMGFTGVYIAKDGHVIKDECIEYS